MSRSKTNVKSRDPIREPSWLVAQLDEVNPNPKLTRMKPKHAQFKSVINYKFSNRVKFGVSRVGSGQVSCPKFQQIFGFFFSFSFSLKSTKFRKDTNIIYSGYAYAIWDSNVGSEPNPKPIKPNSYSTFRWVGPCGFAFARHKLQPWIRFNSIFHRHFVLGFDRF